MGGVGFVLLMILMVATAAVLLVGIAVMVKGGKANEKYGNKMMTWRVMLQGAALLLLGVLFMASQSA